MAEEIKAFKTKDGRIFDDQKEAAAHEAFEKITIFLMCMPLPDVGDVEGWADFLVSNHGPIYDALEPVARAHKGPTMRGGT